MWFFRHDKYNNYCLVVKKVSFNVTKGTNVREMMSQTGLIDDKTTDLNKMY